MRLPVFMLVIVMMIVVMRLTVMVIVVMRLPVVMIVAVIMIMITIVIVTMTACMRQRIKLLMQHLIGKLERHFIKHSKWSDRHTPLHRYIFNTGSAHTLAKQSHAFIDVGPKNPRSEKSARILHHDGCFGDLLDKVIGLRKRCLARCSSANDFDKRHFFHRREKMQPDELLGSGTCLGKLADRNSRCIGGKDA